MEREQATEKKNCYKVVKKKKIVIKWSNCCRSFTLESPAMKQKRKIIDPSATLRNATEIDKKMTVNKTHSVTTTTIYYSLYRYSPTTTNYRSNLYHSSGVTLFSFQTGLSFYKREPSHLPGKNLLQQISSVLSDSNFVHYYPLLATPLHPLYTASTTTSTTDNTTTAY